MARRAALTPEEVGAASALVLEELPRAGLDVGRLRPRLPLGRGMGRARHERARRVARGGVAGDRGRPADAEQRPAVPGAAVRPDPRPSPRLRPRQQPPRPRRRLVRPLRRATTASAEDRRRLRVGARRGRDPRRAVGHEARPRPQRLDRETTQSFAPSLGEHCASVARAILYQWPLSRARSTRSTTTSSR